MSAIDGLCVWNTRSTPSPCDTLRTVNELLSPRLRSAMTTPSYACTRSRSPSRTLTCTTTVSPGPRSGTLRFMERDSSSCMILFMVRFPMSVPVPIPSSARRLDAGRPAIFLEQRALVLRQAAAREQVGTLLPGPSQRLHQPPAPDRGMVASEQHRRHRPPVPDLRPRVVRPVEQPVAERILGRRLRVAQNAGQQPRH